MNTHTQVTMKRGNVRDVCWIPSKFAIKGKRLRINDEEGWVVTGTGGLPLSSAYIAERKNDYRSQRAASDI